MNFTAKKCLCILLFACCLYPSLSLDKDLAKLFKLTKKAKRHRLYKRTEAPRERFPFYVSFRLNLVELHFCSGTLISPKWILTSASCMDREFSGPLVENATVHIGIRNLDPEIPKKFKKPKSKFRKNEDEPCDPDLNMEIKRIEIPKRYSNGSKGRPPYDARYDIALVELKQRSLQPWALLPIELSECCTDVDFLNVGLGRSTHSGPFAEMLEMAVFPYMPFEKCSTAFENWTDPTLGIGTKNISSEMTICADGKREYCQLDKGSGLLQYRGDKMPPVLVGFANRATQECSYGRPYAFSAISFHTEWILGIKGVLEDMTEYKRNASTCEPPIKIEPRVLGGAEAVQGRHPYAVSIRSPFHLCQGVLITPWHVLTAGSCVDPLEFSENVGRIEAYIGGIALEPESDRGEYDLRKAKALIHHHNYGHSKRHVDLAIIVLDKPSKKTPIRLPFKSRRCCRNGMPLRVYGWGATSKTGRMSQRLKTGIMHYLHGDSCIDRGSIDRLHSKAFCAESVKSGSTLCRGDNGTPLFLAIGAGQDVLIGIGYGEAIVRCEKQPVAFLKIARYLGWLRRKIPKLKSKNLGAS